MKKTFWAILVLISLGVIAFSVIGLFIGFNNSKNDVFVGLCTLYTGILAITGVCFTIFNSQRLKNKELLNELDQKSEWRKELMNIAAKPVMQLEDVYRILASLRFLPKSKDEIEGNKKEKIKESEQKDFDKISNYIYKQLIGKISNFYLNNIDINKTSEKESSEKESSEKEISSYSFNILNSEEIRQYVKFLLKHHWEYNKSEKDKKKFKKKELEEFKKVINEIERLNKKTSIKNDYYETKDIYIGDLEENSEDRQ